MVKSIHRHIIKEVLVVFVISVVCLDFVLMMEKILRLSRLFAGVGASFIDIFKIVLFIQPQLLVLTIPMSFLLALLITYGRMNMDSEVIIMRAIGMSMRQIAVPAVVVGCFAFIITTFMTFYLMPVSAGKLRALINETIKSRAPLSLEEGIFHNAFKGITILIGEKPSQGEMKDIFIYDTRNVQRPKTISADSGRILMNEEGDPVFDIRDGFITITHDNTFTEIGFEEYVFRLDIGLGLASKKRSEKTPRALLAEARQQQGDRWRGTYIAFHRRLTLPLINIFLIFLGPALSMKSGRSGRLSGFIYGVFVFGAYYAVLLYCENLVRSATVPHYFAWAPIVMLGLVSVTLYWREAKK